jgi:signal transduction histidine kinase
MTRVLIADDNPKNIYLLEAILKGSGYEVVPAQNGAEALERAREAPPDLIITDILMPVMDGFELCRQWKADAVLKTVPFIFYTATYTDPKDEKFALSLGADRFLTKPQKPDVLLREIRDVLAGNGGKTPGAKGPEGRNETEVLRQYNEVLFRKLEKKIQELETEIAERKNAEQQRELVIRALEHKNDELAQFTYTVSHELRSPLITIQGFAGMIEDELARGAPEPSRLTEHTKRISTAVETLASLLSDLLKLSRAGQGAYQPVPVALSAVIDEATALLATSLAENRVRLEIAPGLPVVTADPARLREVYFNLIENAIKFRGTQEDLAITIGVERDAGDPVFFVRDNGSGIDRAYLSRIFNLFEKLDAETPGTGVGLAIVKRIIEVHGGKIWAESEGPGTGTTFWFTLPVRNPGTLPEVP